MEKNFQNRVLLVAENISEQSKEYFEEYCHYAILLIGSPIGWRERKDTMYEDKKKQCAILDREQCCIVYGKKEDLEKNQGTYWESIPEFEQEILYEYTAKII